jgi:hypothetical protein
LLWYFGNRISWTICLSRPWASIFLISAFQVSRIIGRSHWCPAKEGFLLVGFPELQCT